ncbi:enoyl-CoA hydratase/isomerase family protein [Chloroflexota bacterium]
MKRKLCLYEKDGEIARVTFNRPEKLNAFGFKDDRVDWDGKRLFADFMSALDEAELDDEVKVVIIKGAGRSFSAGFDISRVYHVYEDFDEEPGKRRPSQRTRLWLDKKWTEDNQRILLFPKVTIAQVHGHCIGEGATIAEQCDITVVADDAHISHAEQRLGFAGSGENLVTLFQMVGYKKARAMVLLGDAMDGKEAEKVGWATKSVPFDQLETEVDGMAKQVALLPRDGIAIGKASNHLLLDILGITKGWLHSYITHTLFTNLRFEKGEFNFIQDRDKADAKTAFHKRDDRYEKV